MVAGFYKDIAQKLSEAGYAFHRTCKGSHEMWKHTVSGHTVIVPHSTKSRHTANGILKDAGIDHKF